MRTQRLAVFGIVLLVVGGCNQVFGLEPPERSEIDGAVVADAVIGDTAIEIDAAIDAPIDGEFQDSPLCQGYVVGSIARAWQEAEADCISLGGHLVSIEGLSENTTVRALTAGTIHIGLQRTGGMFSTWTDGTVVGFTNWAPAQPSGENCGQMANDGTWYDADCTTVLNYVCEC
jgi:hypothetical protein